MKKSQTYVDNQRRWISELEKISNQQRSDIQLKASLIKKKDDQIVQLESTIAALRGQRQAATTVLSQRNSVQINAWHQQSLIQYICMLLLCQQN